MSSYLLADRNLSFIANSIIDLKKNPRMDYLVNSLQNKNFVPSTLDYFSSPKLERNARAELFKNLKRMNCEALTARYNDAMPNDEELTSGLKETKNILFCGDITKNLYVLSGVISCYLYQCSEGEVPNNELYKTLEKFKSNLDALICRRLLGDFEDGWADVENLQ